MPCAMLKPLILHGKTPISWWNNRKKRFLTADLPTLTVKKPIKSRWLQDVRYLDDEGAIEVCFTRLVVECITRLDGAEQFFTQYMLSQTANLSSVYSVRLYELLINGKPLLKRLCLNYRYLGVRWGLVIMNITVCVILKGVFWIWLFKKLTRKPT